MQEIDTWEPCFFLLRRMMQFFPFFSLQTTQGWLPLYILDPVGCLVKLLELLGRNEAAMFVVHRAAPCWTWPWLAATATPLQQRRSFGRWPRCSVWGEITEADGDGNGSTRFSGGDAHCIRLEAIASRVEAIATRVHCYHVRSYAECSACHSPMKLSLPWAIALQAAPEAP